MSAAPAIRSTRHLGTCPRTRTSRWVMIGQDGGQSIDLGDRTLIVYSDTLLMATGGEAPPHEQAPEPVAADERCFFVANCAALLDGRDLTAGLAALEFLCSDDGFPREIVPATERERAARLRLWPEHGVRVGDEVLLFYLGVTGLGTNDQWAFRNTGVGLARLDPVSWACSRVEVDGDWRLWPAGAEDLHFGVQVLVEDDVACVFGSVRDGFDVHAFVARVALGELADPRAYEYYEPGGRRWVRERTAAASLGPAGADFSVSRNEHLGGYMMVYNDAFTKRLALRFAERPEGPYSAPVNAGRLPHAPESELVYLALEHPQFARDAGRRVLVTYCEPHFRMPSLLEVRLA